MGAYVHGYDDRESERLGNQALTLEKLLHADLLWPGGVQILEAGCGNGAQTVALARRNPAARITAVDIPPASLVEAAKRLAREGIHNVHLDQQDINSLPFAPATFDHIFICFVVEHLPDPLATLARLRPLLRPGGTITVIEGDHGTVCFHPEHAAARAVIACQVELQRRAGGDANIGRRLNPLPAAAGFNAVHVSPRMVHADASDPALADGFTRRIFTAMIQAVRTQAVAADLLSPVAFDEGIRALGRTAEAPDGVFCCTFFKAIGHSA